MSLSYEEVGRIARLARIALSSAEISAAQGQMNGILSLIETLQAADTHGIEPMAHTTDVCQRLREDTVTYLDQDGALRARFQALAPEAEEGLYLVPRVIE